MRTHSKGVAVTIFGLWLAIAILFITQSRASGRKVTLTGVISDSMCGTQHMMNGDDAHCTRSCVKGGSQYVLKAEDKIYLLKGKPEDLDRLAAQKVIVSGDLSDSFLAIASIGPAQGAARHDPKPKGEEGPRPALISIEGLVRDVACPIQNKDATAMEFNLKCAQECARLGSPLIILTQEGVLYTPISESMPDRDQRKRLLPFVGKYVRVTGPVFERNGSRAIAVKTIEELKDVHLKTDAE